MLQYGQLSDSSESGFLQLQSFIQRNYRCWHGASGEPSRHLHNFHRVWWWRSLLGNGHKYTVPVQCNKYLDRAVSTVYLSTSSHYGHDTSTFCLEAFCPDRTSAYVSYLQGLNLFVKVQPLQLEMNVDAVFHWTKM